jgi:uncharacterized protein with HEPN domain
MIGPEQLDRMPEAHAVCLHHPVDQRSPRPARSQAMPQVPRRRDHKRRLVVFVEWTEAAKKRLSGFVSRDWAFRVHDILGAIAKIQRFVSDVDFEAFENDEELIDAVIHNLTVIGEAANHVPSEITGRHPEIPWRQMVDLLNFSVHAYWNLLPSVIWDTIQNDLPPLVAPLRKLLPDDEG